MSSELSGSELLVSSCGMGCHTPRGRGKGCSCINVAKVMMKSTQIASSRMKGPPPCGAVGAPEELEVEVDSVMDERGKCVEGAEATEPRCRRICQGQRCSHLVPHDAPCWAVSFINSVTSTTESIHSSVASTPCLPCIYGGPQLFEVLILFSVIIPRRLKRSRATAVIPPGYRNEFGHWPEDHQKFWIRECRDAPGSQRVCQVNLCHCISTVDSKVYLGRVPDL